MPKKLTVMLPDELDERFREAVFKAKGMHKGNMSEAIEEALDLWIAEQSQQAKKSGTKKE
jgi:Arc/MetJ-type ribon-helix-helix transcriptional regulator